MKFYLINETTLSLVCFTSTSEEAIEQLENYRACFPLCEFKIYDHVPIGVHWRDYVEVEEQE